MALLLLGAGSAAADTTFWSDVPGFMLKDVAPAPDGGARVVGFDSDYNGIVAELDSDGRPVQGWSLVRGTTLNNWLPNRIESDGMGGSWVLSKAVATTYVTHFSPALSPLYSRKLDGLLNGIAPAPDGGAWLVGSTGNAVRTLRVVRVRSDATIAWARQFPGPDAAGLDVVPVGSKCLVLATRSTFPPSWLLLIDENGDVAWQGGLSPYPAFLAGLANGQALMAYGGSPHRLMCIEPDSGASIWQHRWTQPGRILGGTPALGLDGGVLMVDLGNFVLDLFGVDASGNVSFDSVHDHVTPTTVSGNWRATTSDGSIWSVLPSNLSNGDLLGQLVRLDAAGYLSDACLEEPDGAPVREDRSDTLTPTTDSAAAITTSAPFAWPWRPAPFGHEAICMRVRSGPPGEVSPPHAAAPLRVTRSELSWEEGALSGSESFVVYRGDGVALRAGDHGSCIAGNLVTPTLTELDTPPANTLWCYLVAGRNAMGEGPLGRGTMAYRVTPAPSCP